MQDTIGELWIQTCIATTFRYDIWCMLTLVTRKLQVVCGHSTYQMTALLSEMPSFCVRAGCEIRMASYTCMSPKTHRSLFPMSHFCVYSVLRHITWKLQVICGRSAYRTTAILSETFFVWFRVALEIWLESYGLRHASAVLWYSIVCIYCNPIYTSLFGT